MKLYLGKFQELEGRRWGRRTTRTCYPSSLPGPLYPCFGSLYGVKGGTGTVLVATVKGVRGTTTGSLSFPYISSTGRV